MKFLCFWHISPPFYFCVFFSESEMKRPRLLSNLSSVNNLALSQYFRNQGKWKNLVMSIRAKHKQRESTTSNKSENRGANGNKLWCHKVCLWAGFFSGLEKLTHRRHWLLPEKLHSSHVLFPFFSLFFNVQQDNWTLTVFHFTNKLMIVFMEWLYPIFRFLFRFLLWKCKGLKTFAFLETWAIWASASS